MLDHSKPGRIDLPLTLGAIVATPAALGALERANTTPRELLARHLRGDWGDLGSEDTLANERALLEGARLLSTYCLPATGQRVWVITEWDRSSTTVLPPDEY